MNVRTHSAKSIAKGRAGNASSSGLMGLIRKLHSIEFGAKRGGDPTRIKSAQLADLLRMLLMLLENGLSLPRALQSLAADRSTRKFAHVLDRLRMTIEAGGSLSSGMERYPRTFTAMQIQQVRIGERSGALEKALARVCEQMERQVALRKRIIKKVSYPILITLAGTGLMIFMCVVVVPEFEVVYSSSGVDLPFVTQVVTAASRMVLGYGCLAFPIAIVFIVAWLAARSRPKISRKLDSFLLKIPLVGPWLRDVAILQFVEAISSMVECGYTPVDAVGVAWECVGNREVRATVESVNRSVLRGEKISSELEKHERFFPATLCQLVGVGEQSGDFPKAMRGTCEHLRERLESRIDATVGLLEPVLTISLAVAIGVMVLSIYTPMFHMFEVLE
ncbi:putative type II secretion system protein F [Rubripirellula amarantea]|uniref:Putative type II secretion system protein F n=1 Tax=Rubripirellula amarantea TaxID=2527999 RepID=A0A5C5WUK6_9BACT|nr:type II secretion system F family protein [Rubripirellula amarantea]TWT53929.1 putative type II secretion system protein F [Rubripirellula amarantea]